jgi:hypothetical protein
MTVHVIKEKLFSFGLVICRMNATKTIQPSFSAQEERKRERERLKTRERETKTAVVTQ